MKYHEYMVTKVDSIWHEKIIYDEEFDPKYYPRNPGSTLGVHKVNIEGNTSSF